MDKYVFKKYTTKYKQYFAREKKKLRVNFSSIYIEHIGSTAVAELGGKGIVDIMIGFLPGTMLRSKLKLEKAGYEFRPVASEPGRYFFRKDYKYRKNIRRIHIHLLKYQGQEWCSLINFRNFLRSNSQAVKEYEDIKKRGVKKAKGEGGVYRKYKQKFIESNSNKKILNLFCIKFS